MDINKYCEEHVWLKSSAALCTHLVSFIGLRNVFFQSAVLISLYVFFLFVCFMWSLFEVNQWQFIDGFHDDLFLSFEPVLGRFASMITSNAKH